MKNSCLTLDLKAMIIFGRNRTRHLSSMVKYFSTKSVIPTTQIRSKKLKLSTFGLAKIRLKGTKCNIYFNTWFLHTENKYREMIKIQRWIKICSFYKNQITKKWELNTHKCCYTQTNKKWDINLKMITWSKWKLFKTKKTERKNEWMFDTCDLMTCECHLLWSCSGLKV